jgi:class 3 adenylate cyclase
LIDLGSFTTSDFGKTVRQDFDRRRGFMFAHAERVALSGGESLEGRKLGHPEFEDLRLGEQRTAPMVAVFLDLTNFTGRTFWDDSSETADLAHAVLSGFVETVVRFGGHPLGLRGDGLFAGFSPGDPKFTALMALSACGFALNAVEEAVNPWLRQRGKQPVQARAGVDMGDITFVRSGFSGSSEINPIGFAANFAAKCEKTAKSWEIVVGQGVADLWPDLKDFTQHEQSPKRYTRDYETVSYHFYDYNWRASRADLDGVPAVLAGTATSAITRTKGY